MVPNTVWESLDLLGILGDYEEERGYAPYHPAMMTALLLCPYCLRIYSSHRTARACEQGVGSVAATER